MNKDAAPPLALPHAAPLMILPHAVLFPGALLPLFIFEPRYRAMLRWVLANERVFCIAQMKPGVTEAHTPADFHHTGGIGLVRACVGREDGTSHLVLQGLARVGFTAFVQEAPFRIAELRELPSVPSPGAHCEKLVAKVLAICADMRAAGAAIPEAFDQQLAQIEDPSMLADIIANAFVRDGSRRQAILEELHMGQRLQLVIESLSAERSGNGGD